MTKGDDSSLVQGLRSIYLKRKRGGARAYSQAKMAHEIGIDAIHLNRLFRRLRDKEPIFLHNTTRDAVSVIIARTSRGS